MPSLREICRTCNNGKQKPLETFHESTLNSITTVIMVSANWSASCYTTVSELEEIVEGTERQMVLPVGWTALYQSRDLATLIQARSLTGSQKEVNL